MPKLSPDELVRDLRARRIMVDGGNGNIYDVADEVCEQAADWIEQQPTILARRFMHFVAWSGNITSDQAARLRKEFETEFDPGKSSHVEDLERKIALVMAHDSNLIDGLERMESLAEKHGLRV